MGDTGPAGPTGPTGPAGSAGASGFISFYADPSATPTFIGFPVSVDDGIVNDLALGMAQGSLKDNSFLGVTAVGVRENGVYQFIHSEVSDYSCEFMLIKNGQRIIESSSHGRIGQTTWMGRLQQDDTIGLKAVSCNNSWYNSKVKPGGVSLIGIQLSKDDNVIQ
jgi:hypothetical protein